MYYTKGKPDLINLAKNYSPSRIKEIAKLVKMSEDKVKRHIWEKSEGNLEDYPLKKLKRDVAKITELWVSYNAHNLLRDKTFVRNSPKPIYLRFRREKQQNYTFMFYFKLFMKPLDSLIV